MQATASRRELIAEKSNATIGSSLGLFVALCAVLIGLHAPLLSLPFHWDELGQFVPAAYDLFHDGAWIPHSTVPNIHPPGVMAILAAVWTVAGFSIAAARVTMLVLAALGLWLTYRLAGRLNQGLPSSPAMMVVLLLMASPLFYTQSMLVLLDMPAMTFTLLALLLFLDGRYAWCAFACTALVLLKETAITAPMVFAGWLWFRDRKRAQAFYFSLPAIALLGWLLILRDATGSLFGNREFATYNVTESLDFWHILQGTLRRLYFLLFADGHWIGAITLYFGWRQLRGRDWELAAWVSGAQVAAVTLVGGAELERYLLPALPILYAAIVGAASVLSDRTRWTSRIAMVALLVAGWFVNPPYPTPSENNLAMVDFVRLQQSAASYLEQTSPRALVATSWPFSNALRSPILGYVTRPLRVLDARAQTRADLESIDLKRADYVVLYPRSWPPPSALAEIKLLRDVTQIFVEPRLTATPEMMKQLGFAPLRRWDRGRQWIQIYEKTEPAARLR